MGRKFFGNKGRGKGVGKSATPSGKGSASDGPCLRCERKHATRDCPQARDKTAEKAMATEAHADLIFFNDATLFGEHVEEPSTAWTSNGSINKMTTQKAMRAGYGVLDPGATRTMGSITALEYARQASLVHQDADNIVEVDVEDQPRFNFADSESARCSSTCLTQLPVAECGMKLRVHALDKGSVPVLLSIETLKKMKDYGNNEAVFVGINPQK